MDTSENGIWVGDNVISLPIGTDGTIIPLPI